ncbi:hypothetical protein [Silvibacterium dinghuense]|uniref:Uncharacterized protein n=1 Tax=Silvibacterium dinghuense TaxID=1560006 RepID=A0A4Q1SIK3_9BACT|nr:hypothetical protein [Silvibacterium dinghuense]RXS97235.1 hypothetical protein ESZ00_04795 [Silvibacterium dinghuense]GGG97312.1 hypothetical protein GCM10011586_10750 [Silvibacterium dinghuense]
MRSRTGTNAPKARFALRVVALRGAVCENPHPMRLLDWLTDLFVDTFGITRPQPEQRRRISLILGIPLLLFLLAIVALTVLFFVLSSR